MRRRLRSAQLRLVPLEFLGVRARASRLSLGVGARVASASVTARALNLRRARGPRRVRPTPPARAALCALCATG